ncbi:MAG TPA: DUF928 domain-containing protein [Myxococcota bacterium]|nr:DUF928 domain-containing protein [Myxococcota bacterium]
MKRSLLVSFALGILAALATAEDRNPPSRTPPVASPPPTSTSAPGAIALPRYVPPVHGSPRSSVGAGTRTAGVTAHVEAISPDPLGQTLSPSPSLYWQLSEPTSARVDFTLTDEASVAPLVEKTLSGPFAAGMHRIDLDALGVKLVPGTEYQWYVSLVSDPEERSSDVVTGGTVLLVEGGALREEVARVSAEERPLVLAQNGIWYDAVDALSRRIESQPSDPTPRRQLAALLEQVGLEPAAPEATAHPNP